MRAELWRAVCDLAERQHGLVSTRQLAALGVGRKTVERALERNVLARVRQDVVAVRGAPLSPWRDVMAACLAVPGSVASHRTAARLHRLPGFLPGPVDVTVFGRTPPRRQGIRGHRSWIASDDVTAVDNIPVTTAARTLVDVAPLVDRSRLARLIDDLERRSRASYAEVDACLQRLGSSGRAGAHLLRPLLADRTNVDSHLERLWLRHLRAARVPEPVTQYQLVVDGSVLVLDFAWPDRRVGLEIDGWAPHRVRGAFDNDRRRDLLFRLVAWTVLRATSRTDPALLIRALAEALSR